MAITANNARRGNPLRLAVWGGAGLLLLLPAVAMRFTAEVNWDETDFLVMGALLLFACGGYELAARMPGGRSYRAGAGAAIVAAFLLVWVNLAVGFLGGEGNPANLLFAGVIAVAIVGAVAARGRPAGMARAMTAAAVAQALVGAAALTFGLGSPGGQGLYEVALGTTLFGGLWLLSAWLFRRASA
ncbi:MAG: hypothetical protein AVDCRST_MAG39-369 [uncultured Sphingomonadaceae bacterium]|uniref:Uncharacterized protein n=1 Tax=uncultured Sphingomonadaceae bacterium TaxID=169976 RepID=A0A6J4S3Q1_9SPHN|nr:MAG: hypothetical protein AVDCRST_MAG39-369 [uncultured Sphingomonadaceae bacterium]